MIDLDYYFSFMNARHYDPEVGRFVTADSVVDGEASTQGWNRYMYVKGNPVRYGDPTGNRLDDCTINNVPNRSFLDSVTSKMNEWSQSSSSINIHKISPRA